MKNKFIAGLIALVAGVAALSAQNGITTPYSRYGYGILSDNATSAQQAMGGVGYAMNSGRQINVMNPASYARIDSLTFLFDMGVDASTVWRHETIDGTRTSAKDFGGGLSYITMQFPIAKRFGMSVGLLPYASVGYAFGDGIDNGAVSMQGEGSINQLYLGFSGRIVGSLTAGINMAYLFGSTINDTYAISEESSTSLYERQVEVRDWHLTAGLQYTLNLGKHAVTLGAVYSPAKKLLGHSYLYKQDLSSESTMSQIESDKLQDSYGLPATYGAGINYALDRRLQVEADFTYQPWADAKYQGETGKLANRYKISLGSQYQPAQRGSYLRRTQYRIGGYYNRDYLTIASNNVREYGASLGLGLPIPGYKTVLNIGLGWMHRQAYPAALVKENYLNITVGINFNEMWFRKNRIY